MNSITFDFDGYTVQLVNDQILIWQGLPDHRPDIEMDAVKLRNILSTASMLMKDEK